jgi:LPS export ABC transporter permease LptG/LPS export ABC transporter permease LptF
MRILTRYILREVTSHALIGTSIFTFVLFVQNLGRLLELVVRASAPLPSVAELFFFTVPVTLNYTIPMGVLVGILIGMSRLAADSEITAMRAGGIGVWTFLRIVSIFAVGACLLALVNGVYIAPKSQAALGRLQERLKSSQVSFDVQPRVFYEGFPQMVLYVQDVRAARGAAIWKGIFMADLSTPAPRITLAEQGIVVSEGPERLHLHLTDGSTHETDAKDPNHYQITTFGQFDMLIEMPQPSRQEEEPAPIAQLSTWELRREAPRVNPIGARWFYIEFHRRFALPMACLVLALVGMPLGLSSKKGGKSSGFVLTILLVLAYYAVTLIGVSFARQGRIPPAAGAWLADGVFFLAGAFLLWRAERKPFEIAALNWSRLKRQPTRNGGTRFRPAYGRHALRRAEGRGMFGARFPTILDDYVLRDFLVYLFLVLGAFLMLFLVFTVFDLLADILRNGISALVVCEYLISVIPFYLYSILPLGVLMAVLITLGVLQRSSEITAIKATGISVYRIIVPLLIVAVLLGSALFFSDEFYLPYANKRQDSLRSAIKGKPAQTYLNPRRNWIFGQHSDIYYYQLFDSDRDQFGNLSVFQFYPGTFQLSNRVFAGSAHWEDRLQRWVCTQGWERRFQGAAMDKNGYRTYDVATFPSISEPPSYFKKEVKPYSEMNYGELARYIRDLQQGGFDVVRLRVQLQKKLAYPVIAVVMAILAVPFALSTGRRGAITGIATAIGIALVYWTVSGLFEAMGNVSQLPPVLAAWSPNLIFGLVGGYLILKVPT